MIIIKVLSHACSVSSFVNYNGSVYLSHKITSTVCMWSKRTHVLSLPFSAACRSASSFSDSLYFPLIFLSLVHSLSSHLAQRAENYYRYVSVLTTVNNKAHTHSQTTPNHSIFISDNSVLKLSHHFTCPSKQK